MVFYGNNKINHQINGVSIVRLKRNKIKVFIIIFILYNNYYKISLVGLNDQTNIYLFYYIFFSFREIR